MKIQSLDQNIEDVLTLGYYKIPRFQRSFSWEKDQVEEFWNDTVAENDADYFIGSMVVYEEDKKRKLFGIVDGQQRLTTITLTLCALRNIFAQEGFRNLAAGVHNLIERKNINNEQEYILQPETSYPYFQEHIQKWDNPDVEESVGPEEVLIKRAHDIITGNITEAVNSIKESSSLSEEEKKTRVKERLIQIRSLILGLKVIHITLDNEDDAYIIFETMNTRGKDLTLSDLVKSHLLRLIPPRNAKVDVYKDKWNQMVTRLEDSKTTVDEFLYHHWLSKYERYVPAKKLFKSIKRKVKGTIAKAYFNELYNESDIYGGIANPTPTYWLKKGAGIRSSLRAFSIFRVKQHTPMVLAVLRDYKTGKLRMRHVLDILTAIENFHFIFSAVTSQRSSGGISNMYATHAIRLTKSSAPDEKVKTIRSLKSELQKRIPSYQEFEANFEEIHLTESDEKQKRLVQYILEKVDSHHQKGLPIDYDQMTIEHLASQNPKAGKSIGDEFVGQLGNLLLVDSHMNNELANKDFRRKKEILKSSKVWIDPDIRKATAWGEKEISKRTKKMAKLAYETIWKVSA